MSKNKSNVVGISQNKISFEDMYKGRCNNNSFKLVHRGVESDFNESMETSVEILWDSIPERFEQLEEGIRKVFRNRLNAERN